MQNDDYFPRPHPWPCQCATCLEWARVEIETELAQPWAQEELAKALEAMCAELPERVRRALEKKCESSE